jgi:hypothetical protein
MRRSLIASLFVVVLGACSDPGSGARPQPSPAPSPSDETFVNGGACSPVSGSGFPSDAGCLTTVNEGDATLSVYALLNEDAKPRSWRIRLSSDEREIDQSLRAGNEFSYPRAVGASDVDGDGRNEWWVKVLDLAGHGAPWARLNLFFTGDDALIPLNSGDEPFPINYGGISRFGEGATCRDDALVLLRAEAQNPRNTRWTVSERSFDLDDTTATLTGRREASLSIQGYNDPDLNPYYRVDCNGFTYPS